MKKLGCLVSVLAIAITLSACGQNGVSSQPAGTSSSSEEGGLTVLASTYPVYLLASAVAENVDGVTVERLNTGAVSCLHDYTLSVGDMKLIEGADVIAINGVGLEDFMDDALAAARGTVIDCSEGVELLESLGHTHAEGDEADSHGGHYDPHIWMAPQNAVIMAQNIEKGLSQADPDNQELYQENMLKATTFLESWDSDLEALLNWDEGPDITGLVTFHDGFQYFAHAFDLPLLAAIEEEEGSEASAQVINETVALIRENNIPVIFTEVNGSDATAQAIARETGCRVAQLTMLMDGTDSSLEAYYEGLKNNVAAIVNGFAGEDLQ